MPIYGGALNRQYHKQLALKEGIAEKDIIMADNGMAIELSSHFPLRIVGHVTSGALLVDQTGSIVPEIVTKDRLLLKDDGFVIIAVTSDQRSGRLLTSPDILTRGCIAVRDNPEIVERLRLEVKKMTTAKITSRAVADLFKSRLKDMASEYIYKHTGCTPIVIPVVNLIGNHGTNRIAKPVADVC